MNTKNGGPLKLVVILAAVVSLAGSAQAATVYDNSTLTGQFKPLTAESGDQITLSSSPERIVSTFQFEYFASLAGSSGQTATLRFYDNTGAGGTPNALLFDSGAFPIQNGSKTLTVQNLSVTVPNSFTWTVQFSGLGVGESAGLFISDPPSIGSSANDFWINQGGVWTLNQINGGASPANFSARVVAVPEPGVVALALLGGAALLTVRFSRKNS